MALPLTFQALSDVGRARQQNEDSRGELETAGGTLLIVCDGMGGHSAGEVASRIAVDAIGQIFENSPADDPAERLKSGFLVANQRILAHADKEGIDSMGTTAVAAFVRELRQTSPDPASPVTWNEALTVGTDAVIVHVVWPGQRQVLDLVALLAARHGLVCYEPARQVAMS